MLATPENLEHRISRYWLCNCLNNTKISKVNNILLIFIRLNKANAIPELLKLQLAAGHNQDANKPLLFNGREQILYIKLISLWGL